MVIDRDSIKILLILLIISLGLGYAYINSDLSINGTAQVNSANWDVHWANVQVTNGSVSGSNVVTAPTISNNTTVNYSVILPQPGDYYEFTVDAVNGGTIDAMIDTIDSKLNGATITTLPAYLNYTIAYYDGMELEQNHLLSANSTETYKVRIEYNTDINASQLPVSNQTLSLQFTVTYRQATEDAQDVIHPFQLGKYFTLVPDSTTYTIPSTQTGYRAQMAPWSEETTSDSWKTINYVNTSSGTNSTIYHYFCCTSTQPTMNQSTGKYEFSNMSRIRTTAIASGKYCIPNSDSTNSSGSCQEQGRTYNEITGSGVSSQSSTCTSTSCTRYLTFPVTTYVLSGVETAIDQTINPSELTLWRIIKTNIDGSFEAISEYTSSTNISFRGATGYKNIVGALQSIAQQYAKAGYTKSTRMFGYGGQTLFISDTSAFDGSSTTAPSTTSTPTTEVGEEFNNGVLGDTLHLNDYQLVKDVYSSNKTRYGTNGLKAYRVDSPTTATSYWTASRFYYYGDATVFGFRGRYILDSGTSSVAAVLRQYQTGWIDGTYSYALRPIITIKPDLVISGGEGTINDPYTFN